jgi:hypothetical protein
MRVLIYVMFSSSVSAYFMNKSGKFYVSGLLNLL